jgi:hypothetical protein
MKKIIVEFSNERLITPSGLSLVGGALGKSDLVKRANRARIDSKRSQPQIKNGDILLTYIGLLCQGKPSFEAVRELHADPEYYKAALGISYAIPSAETLRQRMDIIGRTLRDEILAANITMFNTIGVKPSSLPCGFVPVDIDVTPCDNSKTSKEGVSRTYKGFDGYAPIMAYIGDEGFLVNTELREGKQHSQKGTPDFLRETLRLAHQMTDQQLLIRMDSGNDAAENLGILIVGSLLRMAPGLSSNGTCAAARPKKDGSKRYRTAVRISVIPVRGKPYTLEAAGRMFPIRQSTVSRRLSACA